MVAYGGVTAWASLTGTAVDKMSETEIAAVALGGDIAQLMFVILVIRQQLPSMSFSLSASTSTFSLGALGAGASITSIALLQSVLNLNSSSQAITSLVDGQTSLGIAALVLSNVVLGPLTEEIVWRSLLLRSLLNSTSNPSASVLISSLAFSAWHLDSSNFLSLFLLGICLGIVYVRGGSSGLSASLIAHSSYNAFALSSLWYYG